MSWLVTCAYGDAGKRFRDREMAEKYAHQHEIRHWVEESCLAQGVPFKVTDPTVLRQVAALLGANSRRADG